HRRARSQSCPPGSDLLHAPVAVRRGHRLVVDDPVRSELRPGVGGGTMDRGRGRQLHRQPDAGVLLHSARGVVAVHAVSHAAVPGGHPADPAYPLRGRHHRRCRALATVPLGDSAATAGHADHLQRPHRRRVADLLRGHLDHHRRRARNRHANPAAAHVPGRVPKFRHGLCQCAGRRPARARRRVVPPGHQSDRLSPDGQPAGGAMRQRPNVIGGAGALIWLVVVGVPLYFVIATSLRESSDYLQAGPLAIPADISLANYAEVLQSDFVRYFVNNVIVTAACVAIVLALSLPAAYAIVRSQNRSVARVFSILLIGLAVPSQAVIVPVYLLITQLRLYDSLLAVILPTAAFSLPLSVVVLTSGLRDIPHELFEAAHLDGAGPWQAMWSVVLPLSRAGLATVGIFAAMQAWNGFLFPLVLTQSA